KVRFHMAHPEEIFVVHKGGTRRLVPSFANPQSKLHRSSGGDDCVATKDADNPSFNLRFARQVQRCWKPRQFQLNMQRCISSSRQPTLERYQLHTVLLSLARRTGNGVDRSRTPAALARPLEAHRTASV